MYIFLRWLHGKAVLSSASIGRSPGKPFRADQPVSFRIPRSFAGVLEPCYTPTRISMELRSVKD